MALVHPDSAGRFDLPRGAVVVRMETKFEGGIGSNESAWALWCFVPEYANEPIWSALPPPEVE